MPRDRGFRLSQISSPRIRSRALTVRATVADELETERVRAGLRQQAYRIDCRPTSACLYHSDSMSSALRFREQRSADMKRRARAYWKSAAWIAKRRAVIERKIATLRAKLNELSELENDQR